MYQQKQTHERCHTLSLLLSIAISSSYEYISRINVNKYTRAFGADTPRPSVAAAAFVIDDDDGNDDDDGDGFVRA